MKWKRRRHIKIEGDNIGKKNQRNPIWIAKATIFLKIQHWTHIEKLSCTSRHQILHQFQEFQCKLLSKQVYFFEFKSNSIEHSIIDSRSKQFENIPTFKKKTREIARFKTHKKSRNSLLQRLHNINILKFHCCNCTKYKWNLTDWIFRSD